MSFPRGETLLSVLSIVAVLSDSVVSIRCCSVARSCLTLCWPPGLQHARLPFPSPPPGACSNSCPSSGWCHPTMSSSVIPFSSCLNFSQHQGLFQWVGYSHQYSSVVHLLLASLTLQFPGFFVCLFCLLSHFLLLTYPIPDLQRWPARCLARELSLSVCARGQLVIMGFVVPMAPPLWCSCEGRRCVLEGRFRLQLACHPLIQMLLFDDIL